jgi:integrase
MPTVAELFKDTVTYYEANGKLDYARDSINRWEKNMEKFWGPTDADAITTMMQENYRARRRKTGAAAATVNREMMLLSKTLKIAYQAEPPRLKRMPRILLFRENNARKVFVTAEELGRLRVAAGEGTYIRCLIELAYLLGWRIGELTSLRLRDVNVPERYIRIDMTKNGEPREVPLTAKATEMLKPFLAGKGRNDRIFPPYYIFENEWRRVKKAAECDHLKFHDFRRTSARVKRNLGVDQGTIMRMQGWRSDAMFRRYAIVDLQDQKNALDRMESLD